MLLNSGIIEDRLIGTHSSEGGFEEEGSWSKDKENVGSFHILIGAILIEF